MRRQTDRSRQIETQTDREIWTKQKEEMKREIEKGGRDRGVNREKKMEKERKIMYQTIPILICLAI